jgi:cytosine/adenosine deaminase-related metal-dependent hydrolase
MRVSALRHEALLLQNCSIFEGHNDQLIEGGYVAVGANRFVEFGPSQPELNRLTRIDCGGRCLMPGFTDCHLHACAPTYYAYGLDRMPLALIALIMRNGNAVRTTLAMR